MSQFPWARAGGRGLKGLSHMALTGLPRAPRDIRPLRRPFGGRPSSQLQRKRRFCSLDFPSLWDPWHPGPCARESLGTERVGFTGPGPPGPPCSGQMRPRSVVRCHLPARVQCRHTACPSEGVTCCPPQQDKTQAVRPSAEGLAVTFILLVMGRRPV